MTSKRALVLAGGGIAGIAWETGILQGIADESPETAEALLAADVLVGTSAGSTVSAQIGSGKPLEALFERQIGAESAELDPGVSIDTVTDLFVKAVLTPNTTKAQKLQQIGTVALSAATVDPAVRRKVIEARLPSHDWPSRVLRISAVDIDTGELVTLDRDSGVSLVDAVEASCAVPAVWPIVTIAGRRFMDGGIGSAVNMVLAADCDTVVALVPQGRSTPSPFGTGAAQEVDGFDGRSLGIFADDESLAAFGENPLNPACRVPSAQAGRAQGRRVAAEVAKFLAG
ncbi:patatin-like phospholipase family protein [Mycolicibacterium peregrinum]|uniref:Patatin-like phospholipase family protein n=1 Tax=Mycolicibacterium peregrinum TaxID=43304 RepID=A0A4Z0HK34_MYCPR|nr:patatin-like phospholipase family protein [Mycolicibacterium peregrinum]TGB37559.1 patatin-like phospholipase family protein [Mycolicibacterium peregrinum]TGB37683.1 patatin-like phospholipase family protein [Mycolicibacterium peregrinum]